MQPIVSPEEQNRLRDSAQSRRKEAAQALASAQGRRLTQQEKRTVQYIESFLRQSQQAEERGDMRQADALAERAQVFARELQGGR